MRQYQTRFIPRRGDMTMLRGWRVVACYEPLDQDGVLFIIERPRWKSVLYDMRDGTWNFLKFMARAISNGLDDLFQSVRRLRNIINRRTRHHHD